MIIPDLYPYKKRTMPWYPPVEPNRRRPPEFPAPDDYYPYIPRPYPKKKEIIRIVEKHPTRHTVEELSNHIKITVLLPGISSKAIKIEFSGDGLWFEATKTVENPLVSSYSFTYKVPRHKYHVEKTSTTLKDGVLTIVIPMRQQNKPDLVSIKVE